MKTSILFKFVLLGLLLSSCSDNNEPVSSETGTGNEEVTSIVLSTTSNEVNTNSLVSFIVTSNTSTDLTSRSSIKLDGVAVSNPLLFNFEGTYEVVATFEDLTSNTVTITVTNVPPSSIELSFDQERYNNGDFATFTVTDNFNNTITNLAEFTLNGSDVISNPYQFTADGTYNFEATYEGLISNSVTINIETATEFSDISSFTDSGAPATFTKKALLEDFTGTWCQYCPRVAYAIELIEAETSDVVITAIHRGNDPYNFSGASVLENQIGLSGYPTAMLNRSTEWSYPETSTTAINQALNLTTGINPKLGVALETSTSGNTSTVNVKVKYGKSFNNLKLVVYALEDHLIYNQTNSTTYYGGSNPIVGFEHNHVLRAVLSSSILGETITGAMGYNDEFSKSFTYTIPSSVNASNVRFVAFVVDSTNAALNSRDAGPNETQTFEIE